MIGQAGGKGVLMISTEQMLLRLFVAAVLGALVGYERERNNQPAGLRTHIILMVGSTLAMMLSINIAIEFKQYVLNGDPTRMAAQVISGIGFLGVGAIIRYGPSIKGLTTATSLWSMAIVGLAVGAGYYLTASLTTVMLLITLILINFLEKRFIKPYFTYQLTVETEDDADTLGNILRVVGKYADASQRIRIRKDLKNRRATYSITLKVKEDLVVDGMLAELTTLEHLIRVDLE